MLLIFVLNISAAIADAPFITPSEDFQSSVITIDLSGNVDWLDTGAGTASIRLTLQNNTIDTFHGELRLIPISINSRIDFRNIEIEAQKYPNSVNISDDVKFQKGFFVIDNVELSQSPQNWLFSVHFPQKSNRSDNILQLYARYGGKDKKYGEWLHSDVLLLKTSTDVD
jgi:hypothetical protein